MKKNYTFSLLLLLAGCLTANANSLMMKREQTNLQKPTVLQATNVTNHGFTANWNEVEGAEAYCVFVYTEHQASSNERFSLIKEDFDLIDFGSIQEPVWGQELYETLDPYTQLPNWSVYGYTSYAQGMVGGVIYSPYFDARNNNGKYDITLTVYGEAGDQVYIHSEGSKEEIKSFMLKESGLTTATFTFTNGIQDTFFHINNSTGTSFYLDEAEVSQELTAGEKAYVLVDLNDEVLGDRNSCDFKRLRFAPNAKTVYYDLYAVVREYNDPEHPDRYDQVYSAFSDKMEVKLSNEGGIENVLQNELVFAANHAICLNLEGLSEVKIFNTQGQQLLNCNLTAGSHSFEMGNGIYLVQVNNSTYKIIIK